MKRIFLFVATNLAVIVVAGFILQILGVDRMLVARGSQLNLQALLVFAAVFGFTGSFISLAISKWIAKRAVGAQVITQPRSPTESWLLNTVGRLAREAGIGMPEVAVYNAPELNAFATGASRNKALVAVSTGLLNSMSHDEAEAVLGHEITHVANGDMVTMALLQGVLNTFVIFFARVIGFVVDRTVFRTERGTGPGFWIVTIVAELVLGVLAGIIAAWFSRQREFRADAGGARLAGNAKMIAALERLRLNSEQSALPNQLAAFGIFGGRGTGFRQLFLSHPPLDERIAALRARQ